MTLLVFDCETYLIKACEACKTLQQIGPNLFSECYDINKGLDYINTLVETFMAKFITSNIIFVVGDKENWRKKYYSEYKKNRKSKPIIYPIILEALQNQYQFVSLPNLEADDTCRIISEDNQNYPDRKILISLDKDFKSFPCELYDPLHDLHININKQEAEYNLMKQILMGDTTDGYSGLPKYGEATTIKFLEAEPRILEDVRQLFKENNQSNLFVRNLNLASMVSLDRYDFNTGNVKILS